ncbi:hypothetical protein PHYC_03689 [Phycisphaerales bacterium]|nr:hypothetical protein PHYC_03689 [Phycisphaerales bacterium]
MGRSLTAVGTSEAFRWTATTGIVGLGYANPGDYYSESMAVSRDGTTVVGMSFGPSGALSAFKWTEAAGMQILPPAPGTGGFSTEASGVNFNGRIIIGRSGQSGTAAVWRDGQVADLGSAPGFSMSGALAVNDDGSVVAGFLLGGGGGQLAGVWTPERGMETLVNYLAFHGVVVPSGINLLTCTAVSADGRTFAGWTGPPPGGQVRQGFVATIPAPGSILLFCTAFCAGCRGRRR